MNSAAQTPAWRRDPADPVARGERVWRDALALALLFLLPALLFQNFKLHWRWPGAVSGDEPHYLVMATSLAHDFDLALENNYAAQDLTRGRHLSHLVIDHHSYLVHPSGAPVLRWDQVFAVESASGDPDDYKNYRIVRRAEHSALDLSVFREISLHPPGYPALLAAVFAPLLRLQPEWFETPMLLFQLALYGFALARLRRWLAIGFWRTALLGAAAPAAYYSFSFYSEGLSASLLLLAVSSYALRETWRTSLCLGLLFFIKEVNGPILVFFGLAALRRDGLAQAFKLSVAPVFAAAFFAIRSWLAFGELRTYIPWETTADIPGAFYEFSLGCNEGLLAFTPALLVAAAGWFRIARSEAPLALILAGTFGCQVLIAILNAHGPAGPSFAYRALVPHATLFLLAACAWPPHFSSRRATRLAALLGAALLTVSAINSLYGLTHRYRGDFACACVHVFLPSASYCLQR